MTFPLIVSTGTMSLPLIITPEMGIPLLISSEEANATYVIKRPHRIKINANNKIINVSLLIFINMIYPLNNNILSKE